MSIACICYRICIQIICIEIMVTLSQRKKHYQNTFIYNLLCKDDERHVILNCPQGGE